MKAIHNGNCIFGIVKFVGNYKLNTILKAIHNTEAENEVLNFVGNYKLKYNFESNSQLITSITKLNSMLGIIS